MLVLPRYEELVRINRNVVRSLYFELSLSRLRSLFGEGRGDEYYDSMIELCEASELYEVALAIRRHLKV